MEEQILPPTHAPLPVQQTQPPASSDGLGWAWTGLLLGIAGTALGLWFSTSSMAAGLFSQPALLGWGFAVITLTTCVLLPGISLLQASKRFRRR